jgi:hypothetical protein
MAAFAFEGIMNKRLSYGLVFALVGGCFSLSACDDDGDSINGGDAGEAGADTGGSSTAGSSNQAGTSSGGKAGSGSGGSPDGGMPQGGAADGGMGGVDEGGAGGTSAGAGGSDAGAAGAAGAGGAGETPLVYACGSDTQYKKVCSAKVAANCPDPTDCADCVTQVTDELVGAQTGCAACDDLLVDYYQCGVDAFESGNTAAGMQCIENFGADFSDTCVEIFGDFFSCNTYLGDNPCPATWPPT